MTAESGYLSSMSKERSQADSMSSVNEPIERWSDEELLEQLRFLEFALTDLEVNYEEDVESPIHVIRAEMARRGLHFDQQAGSPG